MTHPVSHGARPDRDPAARHDAGRQGLLPGQQRPGLRARPAPARRSLAAAFADAACRRGERCLYFAFEESASQIIRNMRSIGLDLGEMDRKGLLQVHSVTARRCTGWRGTWWSMHKLIEDFKPQAVVIDPDHEPGQGGRHGSR
ncbi:MAG: hypothetical protein MZV70_11770 [Desulfobacterales bacterium]|nr:hypothetical protein [Desulfobacterales bacterium]